MCSFYAYVYVFCDFTFCLNVLFSLFCKHVRLSCVFLNKLTYLLTYSLWRQGFTSLFNVPMSLAVTVSTKFEGDTTIRCLVIAADTLRDLDLLTLVSGHTWPVT